MSLSWILCAQGCVFSCLQIVEFVLLFCVPHFGLCLKCYVESHHFSTPLCWICMCSRLCILLPSGCLNCSFFWCLPLGQIWNVMHNLLILQCFSVENLYVVKVVQGLRIQTPFASSMCCKMTTCERHPNWRWTLNQPHPIPRGKDRYINLLWLFIRSNLLWLMHCHSHLSSLICIPWCFHSLSSPVLPDLFLLIVFFPYPQNIHFCPYRSVLGDAYSFLSSQCSSLPLQVCFLWCSSLLVTSADLTRLK